MREVAAASAEPETFEPGDDREAAEATYQRFLDRDGRRRARSRLTRRRPQ